MIELISQHWILSLVGLGGFMLGGTIGVLVMAMVAVNRSAKNAVFYDKEDNVIQ